MPLIKSTFISELKRRADIIKIASRFTQLSPRGGDHWGRCPFHKEKTGSFKVSRERNNFKCFGCGAHGDAVDLVTQLDGISFPEAVEYVALQSGIEVQYQDGTDNKQQRSIRGQLFEAHEIAQAYFKEQVNLPVHGSVRAYVRREREFKAETSRERGFGFAPTYDDFTLWNRLSQKFGADIADQTGLFFKPQGNSPRRLRWSGRLMIPIFDRQGRLCAFTGRIIPGIEDETSLRESKYVNSPNTPIFDKGAMLFNWNNAWKNPPPDGGRMLLVEGQLDTIRMGEVGCPWTVAPQGTSITEQQVELISNYPAGTLSLLDGDFAGRKGALKFLQLGLRFGVDMRFTVLNDDEDPDSLFKGKTPDQAAEILQSLQDRSTSPMLMAVSTKLMEYGEDSPATKQHIADEIIEWLYEAENHVQAHEYIVELAKCLGLDSTTTWMDYKKLIHHTTEQRLNAKRPTLNPVHALSILLKADRLLADGQTLNGLSPEEKLLVDASTTAPVADFTSKAYTGLIRMNATYKGLLENAQFLSDEEIVRIEQILREITEALATPDKLVAALSAAELEKALAILSKAEAVIAKDPTLGTLTPNEKAYVIIQPAKIQTGVDAMGMPTWVNNPDAGKVGLSKDVTLTIKRILRTFPEALKKPLEEPSKQALEGALRIAESFQAPATA